MAQQTPTGERIFTIVFICSLAAYVLVALYFAGFGSNHSPGLALVIVLVVTSWFGPVLAPLTIVFILMRVYGRNNRK